MTAQHVPIPDAPDLNDLRIGSSYVADTHSHTTEGEYLGVETPHGEWSILLRQPKGTISIPRRFILSIRPSRPAPIAA